MLQTIREGHYNNAVMDMPALTGFLKVCEDKKKNCGNGPARIGMTKDQVIRTSWCAPDKVNTTTSASHTKEQWVYQSKDLPHLNHGYLYFDNGRLTTIQETP
jgi:hypothetical protein